MSLGEAIAPFVGRVILAWFFLSEAYNRTIEWNTTVTLLDMRGVPEPAVTHFVAIMVMILGSIALIIGFRARLGALGLLAFVVVSNVFMNDYWNIEDTIDRQAALDVFSCNLALGGGLLVVMGLGPGRFAVED
jgi:putative oxidoreductase